MAVEFSRITNQPIIVVKFLPPFDPVKDLPEATKYSATILNQIKGQLYRIEDMSGVDIDFSNLVMAMAKATEKIPGSMSDSRIEGILVSGQELFELAANAMSQAQYGEKKMTLFATVDEAIAYATAEIAKTK